LILVNSFWTRFCLACISFKALSSATRLRVTLEKKIPKMKITRMKSTEVTKSVNAGHTSMSASLSVLILIELRPVSECAPFWQNVGKTKTQQTTAQENDDQRDDLPR